MNLVDFSKLKSVFVGSSVQSRLQKALDKADRQVERDLGAAYNTLQKAIIDELALVKKITDKPGMVEWLQGQRIDLANAKGRKRA